MIDIELLGIALMNGAALGTFLVIVYGVYLGARAITDLICGDDER